LFITSGAEVHGRDPADAATDLLDAGHLTLVEKARTSGSGLQTRIFERKR
jgi:hypothetical protein